MSPRAGIVGGGLAGLVAYAALRRAGLTPAQIVVFADEADPAAPLRRRSEAICQQRMRSESDGHVLPAAFPGLAVRAAVREFSLVPLARSVCNRYRPSMVEFFDHVETVRERSGWDESLRLGRVRRVRAVDDGFAVDDTVVPHLLLAPGHPGLAMPPEYADDARAVHAYRPHSYAEHVAVVGAGMAAAMEWHNALAAGATVVSIRRRPPLRQPLSAPRPMFSRRGLAGFHALPAPERELLLRRLAAPSYPPGRHWDAPLTRASQAGRFRLATVADGADGVEQVICATGFHRGFEYDPLLAALVADHGLPTAGEHVVLAADSTVPALTDAHRTLALAGACARWAFPAGDTVAGAKYAARRFAARVARTPVSASVVADLPRSPLGVA